MIAITNGQSARTAIATAAAVYFVLTAIQAYAFSRGVSQPIANLTDVARSLAAGEMGRRPALAAPGEVGDLASAVHRLAEQLDARLGALAAEQSVLASLFEALNEGVIAISPAQTVVRINHIGRRLLGIDRPLPFAVDFLPREPTLREAISRAMSGEPTEPEEVTIGNTAMSLTARPLVNGGAVVALFDLTPSKRIEAVRRDFVANVSHELRTPLTIVSGFAETLQDRGIPPNDRLAFAKTILANTQRMQRIVDELLDLSRIESGHWQPRPEKVRLADVATEIFARVTPAAAEKGLELKLDIEPAAATVYADRTALEQILFNLTENAVRHTSTGNVAISARPRTNGVVVAVKDTGSGIPEGHIPRIFERFYRVDAGRSREAGGTGLGLSIVKHLVEAHGGVVDAESKEGVSTEIKVFFPGPNSSAS
ncbi:MAG TPA: ATP-binding protein [Gemmatimonadaceae bacterium]|nr:ATP-binding protein [Gemmatimonadaceae bacterium]